jgi:hypothetical protein
MIQRNNIQQMVEDGGDFGSDLVSQNTALANIINPPAKTAAPATPAKPDYTEALIQQILGSSDSSRWTGAGHGSAQANAADMAKILNSIGISDIHQFGKIPQYETRSQYQGQDVNVDEEGTPYIMVPGPGLDDYGNPMPARQNIDPRQVQQVQVQVGETFGNKETGQVVPTTYSERQTGNFFGGTFEGKGNTGYGVQFRPDGTPVFYTQGASSNDLANIMQMAGPVGQIALAVATGGLSIPQQIAANMAIQVLSGKDIGDAMKSAAVSMAMSQIPGTDVMKDGVKYIEKMGLGETLTSTLTNSFQNAIVSGAKAVITGQDISDAVLNGAAMGGVNGAVNSLLNSVDGYKDLSAAQKRMVSNSVTGVLSGKPLEQTIINSAIAAANAEVKDQLRYKPLSAEDYDELDEDQKKIYDEGGTKAYLQYVRDQKAAQTQTNKDDQTVDVTGKIEPSEPVVPPIDFKSKPVSPVVPIEPVNAGTVNVKSKSDTCPIGTVYNPDTDSCDPVGSQTPQEPIVNPVVPAVPVPSAGTVNVTSKANTCPIGTVYNPDTDSCDPVTEYQPVKVVTPVVSPTETPPSAGTVTVTGKSDTCPIGTVYNPDTDSCDPIGSVSAPVTQPINPTTTDYGNITVTGKRDTCPIGTVYNPDTDSCDPVNEAPAPVQQPVVQPTEPPKPAAPTTPVKVTPAAPTKTVAANTSTPYQEQAQQAPRWVTPDLANVFYYGKDFSSKKQKLNEEGELEQEPYRAVGEPVYAADGGLVDEQKNRENNANDALDLILGQSSYSMSVDDLLNIVKGS